MKKLALLLPVIVVACGSQVVEFPEGTTAPAPPVEEPCDCPPAPVELCTNGVDDDGDGLVDCEDPDCANDVACTSTVVVPPVDSGSPPEDSGTPPTDSGTPEQCTNGVDDDDDGLVDCADPDCAQHEACQSPPDSGPPPAEQCTNGLDDDGDGLVDCADPDCSQLEVCQPPPPPPADGGDVCSSEQERTCEEELHCCMNTCKPLVHDSCKRDRDEHVSCVQNCANQHKVCVKKRSCEKKHH